MTSRRKKIVVIGIVVVTLGGVIAAQIGTRDRGIEVRIEEVGSSDLVATVVASGRIEPKRSVDIASDITGRIISIPVEEGQFVRRGQLLLRIDPTQFQALVQRAEAALSATKASELQTIANREQARRALDRSLELRSRDSNLVTPAELENAETTYAVAAAVAESQGHQVAQTAASLREANDQLAKTTLVSPMDGQITRLAVEEGEVALASTFSRETGLLMTVSDLSVIQVNVLVDETDVVRLRDGDSTEITIDAFPDTTFTGRVTRVSQSASRGAATGAAADRAVDYDVEITLDDPPPEVRPDLSASAKIIINQRVGVLSIPIIALTVREHHAMSTENVARDTSTTETEGVFVVEGGVARFRPVTVGITGEEHFEVLSGLVKGDSIVSGPYQTVRTLAEGAAVRALPDSADNRGNQR
jgi:HlyD family secretion protein